MQRTLVAATSVAFRHTGQASIVGLLVFATSGLYWYVVSGGMIARQKPFAIETFVAGKVLTLSIPSDARAQRSPLDSTSSADLADGREIYQRHCNDCHGFDGSGNTVAGDGLFPPPARLRDAKTASRTDGELF